MENKVVRRELVGEHISLDYTDLDSPIKFFKDLIDKFENLGANYVETYIEKDWDGNVESVEFTPIKKYFESDFEKEVRLALEEEVRQKREVDLKKQKEQHKRELLKILKEKYE